MQSSYLIALALMSNPAACSCECGPACECVDCDCDVKECLTYAEAYQQARAKQCTGLVFYDSQTKESAYQFVSSLADAGWPLDGEAPALVDVASLDAKSKRYWGTDKHPMPFASVLRNEDGRVVGGGILPVSGKTSVDKYARWLTHQKRRHIIPARLIKVKRATAYSGRSFNVSDQLIRQTQSLYRHCDEFGCVYSQSYKQFHKRLKLVGGR